MCCMTRFGGGHPDTRELKKAADALWEDPGIINEFIAAVEEQADLEEDDRRILEGWRHPLTGFFVLERHLSRGSVFIDTETEKVYQVKGLTQTWGEMILYLKPPFPIKATTKTCCMPLQNEGLSVIMISGV